MRPVQFVIRLLLAVRWPVRMASIGSTRSARQTGSALAAIGITHPERGSLRVDAELERCAVFGQGQERLEEIPERVAHDQSDHDTGDCAEHRNLHADQQRPDRELTPGHTQGHPDADLSALRLDDPTDQIERRQRGRDEHQRRECVPEPLVVVDVLVQDSHRVRVVASGHGTAHSQIGDRVGELRLDRVPIGSINDREDDVVDHSRMPADVLRRRQRKVQDREFTRGKDRSLRALVEEVLGRHPEPGVDHRAPAGNGHRSLGRKFALIGELGFDDGRPALDLIVGWSSAVSHPDVIDRFCQPERHPHETCRNQH